MDATPRATFDFTGRGVGVPISIAYTKGIFGGFNLEGAVVGVRHKANKNFYGHDTSARDILLEKKESPPADKKTMLADVYDKLEKCAAAATADPVPTGPAPAVDDKKEDAADCRSHRSDVGLGGYFQLSRLVLE